MPSERVAVIGRGIREKISNTVSNVMRLATENLIAATPVDTGHAQSNWVPSVGKPYTQVDGSREQVSRVAQRNGLEQLRKYDVGRDGPLLFLRNNVGYLRYLDEGSSDQAPANFVADAIMGAATLAPAGMKRAVGTMLRRLARAAYNRGTRP